MTTDKDEEIKELVVPNISKASDHANSTLKANFNIWLREEGFDDFDDLKKQYGILNELLEKESQPN